jgi:hypothetical protein
MLRMLIVGLGRAEPNSFYPRFIGSRFSSSESDAAGGKG